MNGLRPILRTAGSLWFAAVLMTLLLVTMACATVYESLYGAPRALAAFYRSWWFETLLVLLGVNAAAALTLRYPFSKRQIGFALTHAAIIVILAGALISACLGVEGQVAIAEGQTVRHFTVRQDTLTIVDQRDQTTATIDLDGRVFGGFRATDQPKAPNVILGNTRVSIERYLPDSVWSQRVLEDDDPQSPAAIEVSLSASGRDDPIWVFAGHPGPQEQASIVYHVVSDRAELARLLAEQTASQPVSPGLVKVTYGGQAFEIPLVDCLEKAVPLGDTGYSVRALSYYPHAIVGENKRLRNAPDRRVNPAIEVEIAGPSTTETRVAFARFPGFSHGANKIKGLDLTFVAADRATPAAPLEILSGPAGELYARFQLEGSPLTIRELGIGTPVESPWPGLKLGVLRRFEHAKVEWSLKETASLKEDRSPALLLRISTPEQTGETWVQKHHPAPVMVSGTPYELIYGNKQVPLGFALRLNRFRVGTYPGGNQPRSFESQVTTVDPVTGREQSHVINMNHPAKTGGYTLYQSRYSQQEGGQAISFLSVARDPGQPIVFAGYIALMTGMLVVLGTRIAERRRKARLDANGAVRTGDRAAASVSPRPEPSRAPA